jgi:4-amino-4-deoxychorismate lyase
MPRTLCFETICVENRVLKNLSYHEARLNHTRSALYGFTDFWNLSELLLIPDSLENRLYKCRVAYEREIDNIKWEVYTPRTIRKIQRVYHDTIDYAFKYDDRAVLNTLFAQRGNADEILIIKNKLVTDSCYCNTAFFNGKRWLTPSAPLLHGTQRAFLLDNGTLEEAEIKEDAISGFSHIKLFNAMIKWENAPALDIDTIA